MSKEKHHDNTLLFPIDPSPAFISFRFDDNDTTAFL